MVIENRCVTAKKVLCNMPTEPLTPEDRPNYLYLAEWHELAEDHLLGVECQLVLLLESLKHCRELPNKEKIEARMLKVKRRMDDIKEELFRKTLPESVV
jgi:hypothetical protein